MVIADDAADKFAAELTDDELIERADETAAQQAESTDSPGTESPVAPGGLPGWTSRALVGVLLALVVLAWLSSRSADPSQSGLLLDADDYAAQQAGGTWSDIFSSSGLLSNQPWLWWLLWFEVVGLLALPITTWVFGRLPGQGIGLSKLVGLLSIAMPVWFLASNDIVGFSATSVWVMTVLLGIAGAWIASRRRTTLRQDLADNRSYWIRAELVFLAIFVLLVAMRYANPDLWHVWRGGEKPMEMAYFTATARSTTMPPYDPWFGGGYLNYYYLGWYLLAVPTRALRVAPEIAFNLGVATYGALAAVSAYTAVSSLAGLSAQHRVAQGRTPFSGKPARAGLLGVLFLVLVGNLDSIRQTLRHMTEASTSSTGDGTPIVGTVADVASGLMVWLRGDLRPLDWWDVSRVNKGLWDITEFPAWTFLFADLHPHMMTMPIFGLVLLLVIAYAVSMQRGDTFRGLWLAVALGFGLALTRMVHTWDFPTVAVLVLVALGIGWRLHMVATGISLRDSLVDSGLHAAGAFSAYAVLVGPYMRNNLVFDNEVQFLPGFTSNLDDFVIHWGLFVLAGLGYAAYRWFDLSQTREGPAPDPNRFLFFALNTVVVFAVVHVTVGSVAAWVGATLVLLLFLTWRELSEDNPSVAHVAAAGFMALGATIMFGVETIRIGEDIDRMNTVFKFWMQVWHLLAIAAAFGLWWVVQAARAYGKEPVTTGTPGTDETKAEKRPLVDPRLLVFGWRGAVAVLVLGALVFTLRAPGPRLADRFDTNANDGLAGYVWLDSSPDVTNIITREGLALDLAADTEMIDWLRNNVEGSPIVVEAVGPSYQWFGRVTALTGLPAVVGWDWHQKQQRGTFAPQIDERRGAVTAFYRDGDAFAAEQFLTRYDVEYVIVGSTERATMTPNAAAMLDSMPSLSMVFSNDVSSIYRVTA